MMLRLVAVALLVLLVAADPTMYKKNEQNLYEPGERSMTKANSDDAKC